MSQVHYQLIPCPKCQGEFYGPVSVRREPELPLDLQMKVLEYELAATHPYHLVNGSSLKRYSDDKLPEY
ncbi:MAG: hypothetical protein U0V70_14785 [Terriglobia bacterium]